MRKTLGISLFIFFSFFHLSFAEEKIAFIDVDKIINLSDFGKKSYKKIDEGYEKEKKKLLKIEKDLVTKEQDILKQKNILNEEELNSKIENLKKEINDFKLKRNSINEKFAKLKLDKTNEMVQSLNKILSKYAEENNISLVMQKKYIVIGKTGLDITDNVLKIFNKEVK